jgi:hypothetical protein
MSLFNLDGRWDAALIGKSSNSNVDAFYRKLYLVGGRNKQKTLNSLEILDLNAGTWSAGASMATPRYGAAACFDSLGNLYVLGGNRQDNDTSYDTFISAVEKYVPSTNTWSTLASLPNERTHFSAACQFNSAGVEELVISGGKSRNGEYDNSSWALNLTTGFWSQL